MNTNGSVSGRESESWQCLLCVNFAALPEESPGPSGELTGRRRRIVERITLELYCQLDLSLPFREPQVLATNIGALYIR